MTIINGVDIINSVQRGLWRCILIKTYKKVILGIVILLILTIGGAGFYITRGLNSGEKMTINHIDTTKLENGVYKGKYNGGRWSNEVSVTLQDKKITKINVIKSVSFEKPEVTSALINNVIEKQDTTVDSISGATVTSKAYLKAIETALSK